MSRLCCCGALNMIDPVTAIGAASAAFSAIKKGVQIGRDLESMGKDLSRWGKACADFDFAKRQIESPPWYRALSGSVEAQSLELFVQKKQLENQRAELKEYICAFLGPSQWEELLAIEADIRKQQKEHEYKRIEMWQKIFEWSLGILAFLFCVGMLFAFVWFMKTAAS